MRQAFDREWGEGKLRHRLKVLEEISKREEQEAEARERAYYARAAGA